MGCSRYKYLTKEEQLPAVVNDVKKVSRVLTKLGFKVVSLLDLTLPEMNVYIQYFCSMLVQGVYGMFLCCKTLLF